MVPAVGKDRYLSSRRRVIKSEVELGGVRILAEGKGKEDRAGREYYESAGGILDLEGGSGGRMSSINTWFRTEGGGEGVGVVVECCGAGGAVRSGVTPQLREGGKGGGGVSRHQRR